jgi:hypothetical protein
MDTIKEFQIESQIVLDTIWKKLTINNLIKYFIQGIAVAVAVYVIPNRRTNYREVLVISVIAALTFFTLDIFTDDISKAARFGTGFGIGLSLVTQTPLPQHLSGILV